MNDTIDVIERTEAKLSSLGWNLVHLKDYDGGHKSYRATQHAATLFVIIRADGSHKFYNYLTMEEA